MIIIRFVPPRMLRTQLRLSRLVETPVSYKTTNTELASSPLPDHAGLALYLDFGFDVATRSPGLSPAPRWIS